MLDANRLGDADIAALDAERDEADLLDRLDEGQRAAVHDRHFGAIDFDHDIVEAKRIDRGHDMFDRRDRMRRRKAEDGAEIGVADLRGDGLEFGDVAICHADAGKRRRYRLRPG